MSQGISICVPTHTGRGRFVFDLLISVEQSLTCISEPAEVIVVDSSQGAERIELAEYCRAKDKTYLRGPKSAGQKRNIAASKARYDILLFVDSDCLLTNATLHEHLAAMKNAPKDVAGVVGLTKMHGEMTKVWRLLDGTQFHNPCFDFAQRYSEVGWGTTANLSVRRDVFFRARGFALDTFTSVGGEDVDFGLRVIALGYRWVTSPEARILHQRTPLTRLTYVMARLFTYGRADVFLGLRHPERQRVYVNPYALAFATILLTACTFGLHVTSLLASALVPIFAVILAEAARRRLSTNSIYGALGAEIRNPGFLKCFRGAAIDSVFDVGIAWEATRRCRPLRSFTRFNYVDDQTFKPRKRSAALAQSNSDQANDMPVTCK